MSSKLPTNQNEVSLEVQLTDSGVKTSIKSRLIAALDRLSGGHFDRKDRLRDAEADVREAILRAEGAAALEKLKARSDFGDRLIKGYIPNIEYASIQAENHAAIAEIAREEVLALPPPPPPLPPPPGQDDGNESPVIDDDWMNVFTRLSGDASSEGLRRIWAKLLVGEAYNPGAFSKKTLRFISELEPSVARSFERARKRVISKQIYRPERFEGDSYGDYATLEEFGLVHSIGSLGFTLSFDITNGYLDLSIGRNILLIRTKETKFSFPIVGTTRTGAEIANIVEPMTEAEGLALAEEFVRRQAGSIECASWHEMVGMQYKSWPAKILIGDFIPVGGSVPDVGRR